MVPCCNVCHVYDAEGFFTFSEQKMWPEGEEDPWKVVKVKVYGWCEECFKEYQSMINGTNPNPPIEAWEVIF